MNGMMDGIKTWRIDRQQARRGLFVVTGVGLAFCGHWLAGVLSVAIAEPFLDRIPELGGPSAVALVQPVRALACFAIMAATGWAGRFHPWLDDVLGWTRVVLGFDLAWIVFSWMF